MKITLIIFLVKESLVVGKTVQLLEHGHMMVVLSLVMMIPNMLNVRDQNLDQLPFILVLMVETIKMVTTLVVLMDSVSVLEFTEKPPF